MVVVPVAGAVAAVVAVAVLVAVAGTALPRRVRVVSPVALPASPRVAASRVPVVALAGRVGGLQRKVSVACVLPRLRGGRRPTCLPSRLIIGRGADNLMMPLCIGTTTAVFGRSGRPASDTGSAA